MGWRAGLFSDFGCSGNGPSVTSSQPARGAVGPALLGKGPSKTWARTGRVEGGVRSSTNNSTPEGRPKTETKDGLLLRGACETKTMHAKKVFEKRWRRRGRTRNQKTNSGGKPAPEPPRGPPSSRAYESSRKELFKGASRRVEEKKISREPQGAQAPVGLLLCLSLGKGPGSADTLGRAEGPCHHPLGQMSAKWVITKGEAGDGQGRG